MFALRNATYNRRGNGTRIARIDAQPKNLINLGQTIGRTGVVLEGVPPLPATLPTSMSEHDERSGMRAKGEEALGDLAQALLDNPVLHEAVSYSGE